jgi:hypothetical protein
LFAIFPAYTGLPQNVNDTIDMIRCYLDKWDDVLPVATILEVLGIILAIEIAIFLYKIINWSVNKLRGSG